MTKFVKLGKISMSSLGTYNGEIIFMNNNEAWQVIDIQICMIYVTILYEYQDEKSHILIHLSWSIHPLVVLYFLL